MASAEETSFSAKQIEFFEAEVRPLLVEHCYACHSAQAEEVKAGLRLDGRAPLLQGGDSGAAIVPGRPDESMLIEAVRYESVEMPPKDKLPARQIAILEKWIEMGAPWPTEKVPQSGPVAASTSYDWSQLQDGHWAFRPVNKPTPPPVNDTRWSQNEIDRFILARLETAKMKPSPPAEPRILVRRIYYDLIGLPPTPEETDAFVEAAKNNRQQATRQLVDRLLASSHYGERWGRHWLDVARYADDMRHAWRYRDWVVDAFNSDLPYDQFLKLQIAGDLIAGKEGAIATGLFAMGPHYKTDGGDPDGVAKARSETLDDRVDTLSRGLLGLTVSCARCHDHKFDPIPIQDYYSLAGVFNNTKNTDPKSGHHALLDSGSANMKVALRGNLRKPGEVAPRRFLRILSGADSPKFTQGSGREELAKAVADPNNPLTARVMVNRIWQHHFGKALVRTPSNFGTQGDEPTHPLLLDWLASRFVESGWSIKQLHRTIMTSAAYQMSSRHDETSFQLDGDNRLVWRMNPQRLDAESWRDTLLSVTGSLNAKLGGASIADIHSRRRTIYFKVSRNGDNFQTDEYLRLFDFPLMRASVAKRPSSIVPQQYLFLMNSRFMSDRAREFANLVIVSGKDDRTRIDHAYRLLFARQPSTEEQQVGLEFLAEQSRMQVNIDKTNKTKQSPWQQYAQVLLSCNELMYVR